MASIEERVSLAALRDALAEGWSAETSFDPVGWSDRNPALGQCAVTALIVQDHLGGELLRGFVGGTEHYWNRLSNGEELDFTIEQFSPELRGSIAGRVTSRGFVLSFPATRLRYERLREATRRRFPSIRTNA